MRARIHAHFTDLHHERETIEAQHTALAKDTSRADDTDLLDELPELAARLDELPPRIQAELFAAFDIQVRWNPPLKQATFFATITDTTPAIIAALLAHADGDDPASAAAYPDPSTTTGTAPAATATPATSSDAFSGLARLPTRGKTAPNPACEPE